jgi:hypothetical protein
MIIFPSISGIKADENNYLNALTNEKCQYAEIINARFKVFKSAD